jgi:hypothetical protein
MKQTPGLPLKGIITAVLFFACCAPGWAQGLLNRTVSVDAHQQPLADVLRSVGKQGGFYFSYSSDLFHDGRQVTCVAKNKTVKQVLDMLFEGNCQYREVRGHIVLQSGREKYFYVSGYVVDGATGRHMGNTSVYEQQQLASALTNEDGYFRLKLRNKYPSSTTVAVSKDAYLDTFITIKQGYDQEFTVPMMPIRNVSLPEYVVTPGAAKMEKNWLARLFLSSRQQVQSVNINKFFVDKPFQLSAIPGVGTHGKLGAQVINKFSFNMLGGYTAGTNGFEIGGLFNIDRKSVGYAQVAGVFNIVGHAAKGAQVAGVLNSVLDSVEGVQVGGITNFVGGNVRGVQAAGIYDHILGHMEGVQVAGVVNVVQQGLEGLQVAGTGNFVKGDMEGMQVAGTGNITTKTVTGTQIAGTFNFAHRLDGVQIGLVNIADTSNGYSIGLLNIVRKGYHKLVISGSELVDVTIALKTGNARLYSILLLGYNLDDQRQAYTFGYGAGREFSLGKNKKWSLTTEATIQSVYLGDWDDVSLVLRLQPSLHYRPVKWFSIFAGPSCSASFYGGKNQYTGFVAGMPYREYPAAGIANSDFTCWLGWHFGISLF